MNITRNSKRKEADIFRVGRMAMDNLNTMENTIVINPLNKTNYEKRRIIGNDDICH